MSDTYRRALMFVRDGKYPNTNISGYWSQSDKKFVKRMNRKRDRAAHHAIERAAVASYYEDTHADLMDDTEDDYFIFQDNDWDGGWIEDYASDRLGTDEDYCDWPDWDKEDWYAADDFYQERAYARRHPDRVIGDVYDERTIGPQDVGKSLATLLDEVAHIE